MTSIDGGADHGISADAGAALTQVDLRARVSVGARCSVGSGQGRAQARRRVARRGPVTLIGRGADHRRSARARAVPALVDLRALVAIVTRQPVRDGIMATLVGEHVARIHRARGSVVAVLLRTCGAMSPQALLGPVAEHPVVAIRIRPALEIEVEMEQRPLARHGSLPRCIPRCVGAAACNGNRKEPRAASERCRDIHHVAVIERHRTKVGHHVGKRGTVW